MAHTDLRRHDTMSLLKNNALFINIPENVITAFAEHTTHKTIQKGQILYLTGDSAESFYIIEHGWIKLFHETLDGTEAVIDVLTARSSFGEDSAFSDNCYNHHAQAVEDCELLVLPLSLLSRHMTDTPQLALNMLKTLSTHRKIQDKQIEHLAVQNASQRIGCFLLRLCPAEQNSNISLQLPYDKLLLAARLNMKPETFSRALNTLRRETKIQIHGARVEIPNIQTLVEYTCNSCSSLYPCDDL